MALGSSARDTLGFGSGVWRPFAARMRSLPRGRRRCRSVEQRSSAIPRRSLAAAEPENAGRLVQSRADTQSPSGAEPRDAQLPLFQDLAPPVRKSVAILDLADASGVPVMSKGRGAPLPLRLFIRAILSVKPQDRRHSSSRFPVTVEELRDGLFPNGWKAGRDWPRIKQALIEARNYSFNDAGGGYWFMLALRRLPFDENAHGMPDLKDHVVLDIAFPQGMSSGPEVDLPAMGKLSVESGARFRAYIASKSLAWKPGVTRRLVPGSKGRFGWSRNPADYPVLTRADRRRLAFGEKDQKNRTHTQVDSAWRDLPGMVVISEDALDLKTGERGWRIVPAEAVEDLHIRGVLPT